MQSSEGRGLAAASLGAIVVITVAWWALALYPVADAAPEWLWRTRLACFGAMNNGLPNAGGWILLVGEPLGMVGTLYAVWGAALRRDVRWMAGTSWGRLALVATTVVVIGGFQLAGARVLSAAAVEQATQPGIPAQRIATSERGAPMRLVLRDQRGATFDLRSLRGRVTLVTFAFGHCETVCPTIVRELRAVRDRAPGPPIPIVVVTVDPWRDVPERLSTITAAWGLGPSDHALSGSVEDVVATLAHWGVAIARDPRTGDVAHPGLVIVVDGEGRVAARLQGDLTALPRILGNA